MIRIAAFLSLLAAASPAFAQERAIPTLKASVTVESDIVRIGDLVENAGAASGIAIFRAPNFGETGAVSVARVVEALRPHHVIGLNTRGYTEILVSRTGRMISLKDIETRIAESFAHRNGLGDARNLTVTLDREARALNVDSETNALDVVRTHYEPRGGRFEVTFEVPGRDATRRNVLRYAGTILETAEIVAPARPIARGEVLQPGDLIVTRRSKAEIGSEGAITPGEAVGLAAKQALRVGQILRHNDLTKAALVTRNDTVTITYEVPGVLLTLRGTALDSGAEGDIVNVLNVQSKRTLQGVVAGPGRVVVTGLTPRLASNTPSSGAMRRQ